MAYKSTCTSSDSDENDSSLWCQIDPTLLPIFTSDYHYIPSHNSLLTDWKTATNSTNTTSSVNSGFFVNKDGVRHVDRHLLGDCSTDDRSQELSCFHDDSRRSAFNKFVTFDGLSGSASNTATTQTSFPRHSKGLATYAGQPTRFTEFSTGSDDILPTRFSDALRQSDTTTERSGERLHRWREAGKALRSYLTHASVVDNENYLPDDSDECDDFTTDNRWSLLPSVAASTSTTSNCWSSSAASNNTRSTAGSSSKSTVDSACAVCSSCWSADPTSLHSVATTHNGRCLFTSLARSPLSNSTGVIPSDIKQVVSAASDAKPWSVFEAGTGSDDEPLSLTNHCTVTRASEPAPRSYLSSTRSSEPTTNSYLFASSIKESAPGSYMPAHRASEPTLGSYLSALGVNELPSNYCAVADANRTCNGSRCTVSQANTSRPPYQSRLFSSSLHSAQRDHVDFLNPVDTPENSILPLFADLRQNLSRLSEAKERRRKARFVRKNHQKTQQRNSEKVFETSETESSADDNLTSLSVDVLPGIRKYSNVRRSAMAKKRDALKPVDRVEYFQGWSDERLHSCSESDNDDGKLLNEVSEVLRKFEISQRTDRNLTQLTQTNSKKPSISKRPVSTDRQLVDRTAWLVDCLADCESISTDTDDDICGSNLGLTATTAVAVAAAAAAAASLAGLGNDVGNDIVTSPSPDSKTEKSLSSNCSSPLMPVYTYSNTLTDVDVVSEYNRPSPLASLSSDVRLVGMSGDVELNWQAVLTDHDQCDICSDTSISSWDADIDELDSEADDEFECDCPVCMLHRDHITDGWLRSAEELLPSHSTAVSDMPPAASVNDGLFSFTFNEPDYSNLFANTSILDSLFQDVIVQMLQYYPDLLSSHTSAPVTATDFDRLETLQIVRSDLGDNLACSICLCPFEDGENAKTLPCRHFFHTLCIQAWLNKAGTCPVCRDVVVKPPAVVESADIDEHLDQ